ncbi:MAG: nucleoside triphosphate pyrophosphohydrolase [Oscillospiraceae bacterium]|nr:nucleoside triphosphate pyrophosphohydrolase [Oscillospiraceae bacterium]
MSDELKFQKKEKYDINDLLMIVKKLRSPGGCPWDIEQTHESIRQSMLEEAYEVADAIDLNDEAGLCEELGDVLLQVVFHSQLSAEENTFNFLDVADGICKKLVSRHPHVFSNVKVKNTEEVLNNWDAIKKEEKNHSTYTDTLESVPKAFPALMRATKIQKRAAKVGFDWASIDGATDKFYEEIGELKEAIKDKDQQKIEEEFGDLLFSAVNISRFIGVDAEDALGKATSKFTNRFGKVERRAIESGKDIKYMSLEELDSIWDSIKHD